MNFVLPKVEIIDSYESINDGHVIISDQAFEHYVAIVTDKRGYDKFMLILDECRVNLYLIISKSEVPEYVFLVPKQYVSMLASEALDPAMCEYFENEGLDNKYVSIFYDLFFAPNKIDIVFDEHEINMYKPHLSTSHAHIAANLDDIPYRLSTLEKLCDIVPELNLYFTMIPIRITGTDNVIKTTVTSLSSNDILDRLPAKSTLAKNSCCISDYFTRKYGLSDTVTMQQLFDEYCKLLEREYEFVSLSQGSICDYDTRLFPKNHVTQQCYICNVSAIMSYISFAFDPKNQCDFFVQYIAYQMADMLQKYSYLKEVNVFLNKYVYYCNKFKPLVDNYTEMYQKYTKQ